jgi:hydroxymethylpyrimidine kinase/phosphomethylpyrimidine kinase
MREHVVCAVGTTEAHLAVGLGVDVRVLAECGVRPVAVVAAVSAQDAGGLQALAPLEPELIAAQLQSLHAVRIDAFRVGALAEARSAAVIAADIGPRRVPVVYDPVAASSAGGVFADAATFALIAQAFLNVHAVITPNLREAGLLTSSAVHDVPSMIAAARVLCERGASAALIKGGHLAGAPQDVLVYGDEVQIFSSERLDLEMRATGCVLASALAAWLARGAALPDAVQHARDFVHDKIAHARIFSGMRTAY